MLHTAEDGSAKFEESTMIHRLHSAIMFATLLIAAAVLTDPSLMP